MWRLRSYSILIASEGRPDPAIQPAFLQQPDVRLLTIPHEEALEVARRERPSVIIGDLRAPNPSAFESCRRLRADRRTRSIPLILVGSAGLREGASVEADALLCEPIVQREYFEAVRRFVPLPKRRERRHPVNLRFTFQCGERRGQTFSRDLSGSGALLNTDLPVPPGSRLDLTFRVPGQEEEIRCEGVVVRREGETAQPRLTGGLAVLFDGMTEGDRWRLDGFLTRLAARGRFPL